MCTLLYSQSVHALALNAGSMDNDTGGIVCENNVQVCAFHVECNVTRDLTVDFLLYVSKPRINVILAVWN